jgi:uracil phosphoribosyltransferase
MEVLLQKGVPEERILFVNLICCPEGIEAVTKAYPRVKVIWGLMCVIDYYGGD